MGMAVDRARTPGPARWTLHTLAVKALRDGFRRVAAGVLAKDPQDDRSFLGVDLAFARRQTLLCKRPDNAVAVRVAAPGLAGLDAAPEPSSGFVGEILEEQGISSCP